MPFKQGFKQTRGVQSEQEECNAKCERPMITDDKIMDKKKLNTSKDYIHKLCKAIQTDDGDLKIITV